MTKFDPIEIIANALKEAYVPQHSSVAKLACKALSAVNAKIVAPADWPGNCPVCHNELESGTRHVPFNGNQLFACSIIEDNGESMDPYYAGPVLGQAQAFNKAPND